ncbi:MAG TPA: NUDIX hydrolase [Candidatus Omnitrophota bacterium]|nr:NUDIX hydrolase [Candidatus Omnitrophota bacterium]
MEYFQIGLRLPDSMFWVNLRPDAADQIIDPYLARTDLGKIMLEADLQLKKDLARFTSPDTKDGREYWNKLYARAEQLFGAEGLTIPAVTRPWIVPNEIIIKEYKDGAYVYKATMKVMLEQDYLKDAPGYTFDDPRMKELNEYSSELVRQLIIPQLTREVNSSKRYSGLRQVFYSLVLSQWFKQRYAKRQGQQGSAVTDMIDSRDLSGLTSAAAWSKDIYFNQYVQSFKKGEYNKQETVNGLNGITIRQYFSGGILFRLQQGVEAMGRNAPLMTILPAAAEASPERSLPVRVLGNSSEYNLGFNGARLKIHVLEHADLRADTVEQPQKNDGGDAQEETIDWKKRMQRLLMLEIASIVLTTGSMLGFFFSVFYFPHAAALVSTYFGTITRGIAWQELDKKREDAERKRQIAEQPYSPAIKAFLSVPPQYRSAILSAQDHVYGYWRVLEILRDMRYADPDPEIASALEAILHKPYSLAQKLRNVYLVFANLVWFELTVKLQAANILKKYYSQNDPGRVSAFLEENFELLSELMNQASVRAWWDKIFDERFFQREMIASARLMAELYGRDYLLLHTGDFNDEAVYFIQTALGEMNAYDRTLAGADSRKDGGYGLGQQRDGGEGEIRPWSKEYFSAPEFLNRQINLAQKKQSLGRLLKVFMGLTVAAVGAVIVHALIIPGTKLSNIVFVGLCAYVAIVAAVMIYESRIALSEPDILPSELVRWIQEQVQDPFVPRYISAATLSMYVTHQPKLILHKEDRGFGNYDRVLYAYPGQGAERQISSAKYNAIIQSIENYFAAMQDVVKNHWFSRYGPKKGEMMEKYLEKQQDFYFYRKAYARRPYIRKINRYHVHTLNYYEKREFESLRYQGRDTGPFLEKIFDRNVRDIFSRYDQARQDAGAGIQKDGGLAVQAENAMADSQYVLLVLNGISEIQNRRGTKYALTGEEWKKAIAAVLHSLSVIGLDRLLEVRNNIEPSGLSDAQKFILDRAINDLTTAQVLSKVDAGEAVVSGKDGGIVELSQMIRDNFTAMTINEYNAAYAQLESYLRNLNAQLKERGIAMQDYVTIGDAMKALKDDRVLKLLNKKNFAFITRLTGPLVDIVDASGQTVTQTQEWVAHMFGLPHRVAYALVIGPNDEVVFQRLAHGRVEAGSLAAFGSHVEPGADEKETVRRELMKDLRLQALKGKLLPLGKAGQFTYDVKMTNVEDKWLNNNEYRALFAYFLTQEEFEWIRRDRNEMVRDRSLMAFEEFVQSGLWPVRNYAIVSLDALKKAAADGKHAFYMEEDYVDRAESGRVAFNSILEGIVISQARNDTASLTVLDELQELLDKEKAAGLSITERLKGKLSSKLSSVKDRIRPQSDTSQLQRDGGATEKRIREIVELLNILRKENIILENELASAGPAEANGIRERIATNRHLIEQLTEELEAKQEYLRNLPPAQIWAQGRIVQGRKYYIKGAPEELRELYGSERPVFEVEGLYEGPLMEGQKGYFFTGHVYQGNLRISAVVSIDDLEEIPDEDADALDGGMPVADRYRAVDHAGQVKSEAGARSSSSTASGDSTADTPQMISLTAEKIFLKTKIGRTDLWRCRIITRQCVLHMRCVH